MSARTPWQNFAACCSPSTNGEAARGSSLGHRLVPPELVRPDAPASGQASKHSRETVLDYAGQLLLV
jgi:hypothetical protein